MDAVMLNPQGHVYSGRGETNKRLNRPFRLKIQRDFPRYVATTDNDIKHLIAQDLYREIQQEGGLFFDKDGKEMTEKAALSKIKKALKDKKKHSGRRAQTGQKKVSSMAQASLPVPDNVSSLTDSNEDYVFVTLPGFAHEDANAFLFSEELRGDDSLPPLCCEEITEYRPRVPKLDLCTAKGDADEREVEEFQGSL